MTDTTKKALFTICTQRDKVFIVDVLNYLHRFMWVYKDLSTTIDGEVVQTGHLYGFTKLMTFLAKSFPNCAIVLALDGYDTERKKINKGYKAQRTHTYSVEEEMDELIDMCSIIDGVYVCHDDSYEADDVINVVSQSIKNLCEKNSIHKEVYILSNDKDMYQLISESDICSVKVIKKFKSGLDEAEIVGVEDVKEKFEGVAPKDLVKFRSLVGDTSDNLKGYYRFRKSNASIIANNFNVNPDTLDLVLKEGVKYDKSWDKFMNKVTEDYDVFKNNYRIMKLKDFDFDIIPVSWEGITHSREVIVGYMKKYQLNQYMKSCWMYSPYKKEIADLISK